MRSLLRTTLFTTAAIVFSCIAPFGAAAETASTEYLSVYASELRGACLRGETGGSRKAQEDKGYCRGFLYAVITKLESDGTACFSANLSQAFEASVELLAKASPKALSWSVLEAGLKERFPCQGSTGGAADTPSTDAELVCLDPVDILKIAKEKAPDAERIQILNTDTTQISLRSWIRDGYTSNPPEPVEDYVEGVVIRSKSRDIVSVFLISKNSDPKSCWGVNFPYGYGYPP